MDLPSCFRGLRLSTYPGACSYITYKLVLRDLLVPYVIRMDKPAWNSQYFSKSPAGDKEKVGCFW